MAKEHKTVFGAVSISATRRLAVQIFYPVSLRIIHIKATVKNVCEAINFRTTGVSS